MHDVMHHARDSSLLKSCIMIASRTRDKRYLVWGICLCPQCKRYFCLQILREWSACSQQSSTCRHAGSWRYSCKSLSKPGAKCCKANDPDARRARSWHQLHHSSCCYALSYSIAAYKYLPKPMCFCTEHSRDHHALQRLVTAQARTTEQGTCETILRARKVHGSKGRTT